MSTEENINIEQEFEKVKDRHNAEIDELYIFVEELIDRHKKDAEFISNITSEFNCFDDDLKEFGESIIDICYNYIGPRKDIDDVPIFTKKEIEKINKQRKINKKRSDDTYDKRSKSTARDD
jgi:hypothetical protein